MLDLMKKKNQVAPQNVMTSERVSTVVNNESLENSVKNLLLEIKR